MQVLQVKSNYSNTSSFNGINKFVYTILPIKNKPLKNISLNIKNGKFWQTDKLELGTVKYKKSLGKLTQWIKDNKLIGTLKEFTDGNFEGSRIFNDGTSMEFSSFKNKVGTKVRKNGKFAFYSTQDAFNSKGKPNIMTKKQIENIITMNNKQKTLLNYHEKTNNFTQKSKNI